MNRCLEDVTWFCVLVRIMPAVGHVVSIRPVLVLLKPTWRQSATFSHTGGFSHHSSSRCPRRLLLFFQWFYWFLLCNCSFVEHYLASAGGTTNLISSYLLSQITVYCFCERTRPADLRGQGCFLLFWHSQAQNQMHQSWSGPDLALGPSLGLGPGPGPCLGPGPGHLCSRSCSTSVKSTQVCRLTQIRSERLQEQSGRFLQQLLMLLRLNVLSD